jgi:tRNA uridine 5-carbamoylmethylation protein Kti12
MQRVIVLEGPDGAGKSTLGEALAERLGSQLEHDGGPSIDRDHCVRRIREYLSYRKSIRDRSSLFSDSIYKRAFGIEPFVTQREVDDLVRSSARVGNHLMIYVRPPMDVLLKNTDALARSKPHKPPEYARQVKQNLPIIVEEYDKGVRRWSALGQPVIHYDYTSDRIDEVLDAVEVFWNG